MKTVKRTIVVSALAGLASLTAAAVSCADFGRLDAGRVIRAPMTLAVRTVTTNVIETVTEVERPAGDAAGADGIAAEPAEPSVEFVTNLVTVVATNTVVRRDVRLSAADYLAQGWKRVVDDRPAPSAAGKVVVATGWAETDAEIVRQYAEHDAPPEAKAPRKFSKLKIYGVIAQMGAWDEVKAWLEAKDVGGVNGWMAFVLAQEVSEDHALFAPLAEEARQLLGLSEEAFEELLSGCVLEEGGQ